MKQFGKILRFEWNNYLHNKIFVGVTLFLAVALALVMFFPRILEAFRAGEDTGGERPVLLLVCDDAGLAGSVQAAFAAAFPDYEVRLGDDGAEGARQQVASGDVACAFALEDLRSYTYYVDNLSMYDSNTAAADAVLQELWRAEAMIAGGLDPGLAGEILSAQVTHQTVSLGKDQFQNFFYTYVMIFALYMVILLYGQMVATNVATEKSSRAMELLVTSANPVSMMFGKVIASCLAGLFQLVAVFGSVLLCFHINREYWAGMESFFDMPPELFVYMLVFFVLGFFIYAFLYGAIGSTATKLEDINTSVMPITMLFIVAFVVVIVSMTSGDVDNLAMRVCSYIPFTSPMAMFTRIAMSTVPPYEIAISIAVLVGSVIGVGVLSARIYRVGVLLYGTTPKIGAILRALRRA